MIVYKIVRESAIIGRYLSSNVIPELSLEYELNAPTEAKDNSLIFCFINLHTAMDYKDGGYNFEVLECETKHEPTRIFRMLPAWSYDRYARFTFKEFWDKSEYKNDPLNKDIYCYAQDGSFGVPSLTPLRIVECRV